MGQKITAMILMIVLLGSLLSVNQVQAYAASGSVTLTVTPSKTDVKPGEEVTFTVSMGPVTNLVSLQMVLEIPKEMEYVSGSGALESGIKNTLRFDAVDWTESSKMVNGYASSPFTSKETTKLFRFKCKVSENAGAGNLSVGLTNLEFGDANFNLLSSKVTVGAVTVGTKPVVKNEDTFIITVDNKTVTPGSTFSIAVNVEQNPGVGYLRLTPKYDKTVFTLKSAENGSVLTDDYTEDINLVWNEKAENTKTGKLVILTFDVKENAPKGQYEISILARECYDKDTNDVEVVTSSGIVTVSDILWGDVNGDGVINGKDVMVLSRYLAAYNDETGTSSVTIQPGADAYTDGVVNGKDLMLISRYMAAYNDETGTSSVVLGPNRK